MTSSWTWLTFASFDASIIKFLEISSLATRTIILRSARLTFCWTCYTGTWTQQISWTTLGACVGTGAEIAVRLAILTSILAGQVISSWTNIAVCCWIASSVHGTAGLPIMSIPSKASITKSRWAPTQVTRILTCLSTKSISDQVVPSLTNLTTTLIITDIAVSSTKVTDSIL